MNARAPVKPAAAAPASLEAEQGLLGAVIYDNEVFHQIEGLQAEHFHEPLHGLIWQACAELIGKGVLVDPVKLQERLMPEPAFHQLGAMGYLLDMTMQAPAHSVAVSYAPIIRDAAIRRELIKLADEVKNIAMAAPGQSGELLAFIERATLAMQVTSRETTLVSAGQASARVLEALDAPIDQGGGILTGLAPLDQQLGPLLAGDLLLLMGRPSMGKSAAAECIALNIAETGFGVIQINGEMTPEQMARRHQTDVCFRLFGAKGPKYSDIRKRNVTYDQRRMLTKAHEIIEPLPLEMIKRRLKLAQLRSIVRRQVAAWVRQDIPLGAVIVDHVGLLMADTPRLERYEAQTEISNGLKELADELQCVIIGLNQMNRENERREDKRPQLSDLRDSGSWEQDADFVIGFYREAYYASREPEPKSVGARGSKSDLSWDDWDRRRKSKTIEAIVLKAREGECGTAELWGDVARNAIRGAPPEYDGGFL